MIVIVLELMAVTLFLSKLLFRSYLAPLGAFGLVWGISLSLLSITTLPVFPLRDETWLLILGAWFSYLLAASIVGFARVAISKGHLRLSKIALPRTYPIVLTLVGLLALFGSFRYAAIIVSNVGLSGWLDDPLGLRHALTITGFSTGPLTYVFQGITMAAASLGGIWAARQPRFIPAYLPLLAAVIFDAFYLGRAHTIIVTIIFISSTLLSRSVAAKDFGEPMSAYLRKRHKSRSTRVFVVVMFVFIALTYGGISLTRNPIDKDMGVMGNISKAITPYVINFFENWYLVDDVLYTQTSFLAGSNTFLLPKMTLYLVGLLADDPRNDLLSLTSRPTPLGVSPNTYTILGAAYADFGLAGTFALLFALGLLGNQVFVLSQHRPRLWQIAVLSFVYPQLIFSVQGDQIGSPPFNIGFLTSLVIAAFLDRAVKQGVRTTPQRMSKRKFQ